MNKSERLRRIAVVAYVGANAENFLSSVQNLEIICNPEAGATDPAVIRQLIHEGAKIRFSDNLHSKVYWSEKGCIITSANLSSRALGKSEQKETGVLIESKEFDIDRLVKLSEPYDIDQESMDKLEIADRGVRKPIGKKSSQRKTKDYASWYLSPYREPWKIGWWNDSDIKTSKAAIEKSVNEYNVKEPCDVINLSKRQAQSNDWLLCFKTTESGTSEFDWMFVDFVVSVDEKDKKAHEKEYPFQAVQPRESKYYPEPPFKITKHFEDAFSKAAIKHGIKKIESAKNLNPKESLLNDIFENLKNA